MKPALIERRSQIIDLLSRVPLSSTVELAGLTGVSCETMRKDLDILAKENLIMKVHGGVALADKSLADPSFDSRSADFTKQKSIIAKAALHLIDEGDYIILEGSTTCMELAKALLYMPELLATLTIFTNSLTIAALFNDGRLCDGLFYLGGWLNPREHSCRGIHTVNLLKDFYADKAYISGTAIHKDLTLRSYLQDNLLFQRQAIESSKTSILMMDSSKFDKTALYSVCQIDAFDVLVTDIGLQSEYDLLFQNASIQYININTDSGKV